VGPRLLSLGPLLWAAARDAPCVDAVASAYGAAITLSPAELARLGAAMELQPLVLACWSFATGRQRLADAAAWWEAERTRVSAVVERARAALDQ